MRGMEIATLPLDSERIALAVEQAGAHGFFKDFTPGYDTLLGNRFEGRRNSVSEIGKRLLLLVHSGGIHQSLSLLNQRVVLGTQTYLKCKPKSIGDKH